MSLRSPDRSWPKLGTGSNPATWKRVSVDGLQDLMGDKPVVVVETP